MKYKHKPSGREVERMLGSWFIVGTSPRQSIPEWMVAGNDWEEVKEKVWEVVSYVPGCHKMIQSVKRLNDGEVFAIGDKIETGTIEGLYIDFHGTGNNDLWCCTDVIKRYGSVIEYAKKVQAPLFKTEDGFEIFQPNLEVFSVCAKGGWDTRTTSYENYSGYKHGTAFTEASPWKHFYSKEARDEYILLNKPCLSLNDVNVWKDSRDFVGTGWLLNKLQEVVLERSACR